MERLHCTRHLGLVPGVLSGEVTLYQTPWPGSRCPQWRGYIVPDTLAWFQVSSVERLHCTRHLGLVPGVLSGEVILYQTPWPGSRCPQWRGYIVPDTLAWFQVSSVERLHCTRHLGLIPGVLSGEVTLYQTPWPGSRCPQWRGYIVLTVPYPVSLFPIGFCL